MSVMDLSRDELQNRRRGQVVSTIIHVLVLLLILLPLLQYPEPPPGQEGVLISFGEPDVGQGEDNPIVQNETPVEQPEPEKPASSPSATAKPATPQKVVTADDKEAIIKRKQIEETNRENTRQKAAEEARRQQEAESARKAAEAEAKRQEELKKAKQQYSDLLKGGGKGDTNKQGNQGAPSGDPAGQTTGLSKGTGVVGDGLANRGVKSAPVLQDKSQNAGKVVISVCVDRKGNVIKAEFTQRGSTTSNAQLVDLAKRNASRYVFSESDLDEQCGTISYDFKLQ